MAVGGVVCILAAAVFAWQLEAIREHIRPIYRRIGILPEVARGIQTASDPRTGVVAAVAADGEPEEGIQRAGEVRQPPKG